MDAAVQCISEQKYQIRNDQHTKHIVETAAICHIDKFTYHRIITIQLFIVRVPAHVVGTVAIQVQQARIEGHAGNGFQL